jgi:fucose permease
MSLFLTVLFLTVLFFAVLFPTVLSLALDRSCEPHAGRWCPAD